jgi:thiol:disulfide interchange protein DsbD
MQRVLNLFITAALVLFADFAKAAHTEASLLLGAETARPGDTVMAGVHLHMETGWHTYWKNSGAAGFPTKIEWQLPAGITAGEIQWPLPEKTPDGELTTYIYQGDAVLLVPLKLAADLKPGALELKAKVSWLECKEVCIPGKGDVQATLNVGTETKVSLDAAFLKSWKEKLPQSGETLSARALWEKSASGNTRPLIVEFGWLDSGLQIPMDRPDFLPYASDKFEVQPTTEKLPSESGKIRLRKVVKKFEGDWPKEISGVIVTEASGARSGFEVKLPINPTTATGTADATSKKSLLLMLLYAFIGGLILNVMPCVLPVIALKILGFVQQSKQAPQRVFRLGLIYALGVVASFLVLAGVIIGVQQAGGSASWGMQLQNPQFTLFLTVLVTLVALNLFGVFEVTLSGGAMNAADKLAGRHGDAGAFFNGVLATALATPCTAPFLAPALGFAFTQPPVIIVTMFVAVALGLASPYIVLSWRPQWLKFLPKPGAWMEKFKVAMGFPMLATAMWLFSFNARRFGADGPLRIGLCLIAIGLAAWVWGQFVQRGRKGRVLAALISLLLLIGGCAWALTHDAPGWQKWNPESVAKARAEGHPVLVDFTADWCWTCKVNKRVALDVAEVQAKLKEINAVTLVGDNTDEDPAIVAELKKFERAGVPLVLVYPRDASRPPVVLPALLTSGIVLNALDEAAK